MTSNLRQSAAAFSTRLNEHLLARGVTERDVDAGQKLHRQGLGLLAALLRTGGVGESDLYRCAAEVSGAKVLTSPQCDTLATVAEPGAMQLGLSARWCKSQRMMPWLDDDGLCVLMSDWPNDDQLSLMAQFGDFDRAKLHWVPSAWFDERQANPLGVQARAGTSVEQLRLLAEEGPVIELINQVLSQGALRRASDIHIEARELEFQVRYRVDGNMTPAIAYPRELFDAAMVRVKILSGLDIAERRLPQDGRIQVRLNGEDYDIRVSVLPASYGEGVALRLLRSKRQLFSMLDLGMHASDEDYFGSLLDMPNGIVLVTGPTGSGKSTTLYTGLSKVNDGQRKIITVEDPVEYRIEGITQIQANASIGLDFASSLRGILRHDPDVILIGEIRDRETAQIAVQAALTGHLVLSTLHTNSAVGSITRLIDMGIEPFLVSATVRALLAQRLVRRLCVHCKQAVPVSAEFRHAWERARLPVDALPQAIYKANPHGCTHCAHTGFHGRLALYEFAAMNEGVRDAMRKENYAEDVLQAASRSADGHLLADGRALQLQTMLSDGLRKCASGVTTLAEVLAVVE